MNDRLIAKMLAPLARRVSNLVARGVVSAVNAGLKGQAVQVKLLSGEMKDAVEHMEPYGYTANAHGGAECVSVFLDGDRSHGLVLVVADRRYRLQGLQSGEVAIYDDLQQKVHLTREGIVVWSPLDIKLHAGRSYSWDVNGFGERWTWTGGTAWEHRTWQQGATVTEVTGPINPPEGP